MAAHQENLSTGIAGLDHVLRGILAGDNIVWKVDSIESYLDLVAPFCEFALAVERRLVYFRFGSHPPLLSHDSGAEICQLDPREGFEDFISRIHNVIGRSGKGAYYVFDCLSELAADWYSDQMLGNFFALTCPYLYDLETVTYFAVYRDRHSFRAIGPIAETTQILLEDLKYKGTHYVRPLKVHGRFSPTMNMLHSWEGDDFKPVTSSAIISAIFASVEWIGLGARRTLGVADRALLDAEKAIAEPHAGRRDAADHEEHFSRLARMFVSRHEHMLQLADKHLSLDEILDIGKRMIGTGLIGGKAVGMILARAILKNTDARFKELLEEHDSFYVGSDVFYTFLVQNGIWWVREKQRDPHRFLEDAEQARRRIMAGQLPEYVLRQLKDMLEYFGQSPFIVRSSSLLEDNFGNSFAGKYESVFCANQGSMARRLDDLLSAIRTVYASTMSEEALRYREQRGLLDQDEQMALLIMRVSGSMYDKTFFPAVAGVGFSFNPYAWNTYIDPKAGVIRVVFGLGTRAVDRSDDDYTRVVALNAPGRRPESDFNQVRRYSQRRVDYLDFEANHLISGKFEDLAGLCEGIPMGLLTTSGRTTSTRGSTPARKSPGVLTFDGLLADTPFVSDMRDMCAILQRAYSHPVDIEFTCNFMTDIEYKINLVQCRPLQVQGSDSVELPPLEVRKEQCVLMARGAVIGQSRVLPIERLVYVVPEKYGHLPGRDRYDVANVVSRINRLQRRSEGHGVMLIGPGRWGTSTPSLGIPIPFAGINQASAVCEVAAMREDLIPDASLGTHFLNELVEMDMLYLAMSPGEGDNFLNAAFFDGVENRLCALLPGTERWEETIKVVDAGRPGPAESGIVLHADAVSQFACCYFK